MRCPGHFGRPEQKAFLKQALTASLTQRPSRKGRTYELYGIRLRSDVPLPYPALSRHVAAQVTLSKASERVFHAALRKGGLAENGSAWFEHHRFEDGSTLVRWQGEYDFLISPTGARVRYRELPRHRKESFQAYFLPQVLSFALVSMGIEPVHATVVAIGNRAVAFLGDCGYGKSTLAAAFVGAQCRLLTDDLLVLRSRASEVVAFPGLPRIKLFPRPAVTVLKARSRCRMNHGTSKRIIPLSSRRHERRGIPLSAIYVLCAPGNATVRVRSQQLRGHQAVVAIIRNTFNPVTSHPERLRRQFHFACDLVARVPVRSLSYPRLLGKLSLVKARILFDLNSGGAP